MHQNGSAARQPLVSKPQRWILAGILAAVILVDQTSKWWAWRHVGAAMINFRGDVFAGRTVNSWFAAPAIGALLDVIDSLALATAVRVLGRRRRSCGVLIGGGLLIAGSVSNVLDRLGLHQWTAPGSVRGAVDFLPVHTKSVFTLPDISVFNLADLGIAVGAIVLGYSGARSRVGGHTPSSHDRASAPAPRSASAPPRRAVPALAGIALLAALAFAGATNYGGVDHPYARAGAVAPQALPSAAAHGAGLRLTRSSAGFTLVARAIPACNRTG